MNILPKRSFIIPRTGQPPVVCIQNLPINVDRDLIAPYLADGSAVKATAGQQTPTHAEREKAVIG